MVVKRLLLLKFTTNVMSIQISIYVRSVKRRYLIHTTSSRLRIRFRVVQEKYIKIEALKASIIMAKMTVINIIVDTLEVLGLSLGLLLRMLSN
jgi:hypothetical protein